MRRLYNELRDLAVVSAYGVHCKFKVLAYTYIPLTLNQQALSNSILTNLHMMLHAKKNTLDVKKCTANQKHAALQTGS